MLSRIPIVASKRILPICGKRAFTTSTLPLLARRGTAVGAGVVVAPPPQRVANEEAKDTQVVKRSIASTPENVKERIEKAIKKSPVVLYMKGYPEQPMCGFSRAVVMILNNEGVKFDSYNVLDDEGLRQGIKEYSDWPTIPQLYIGGEFVGGADITKNMHVSGELKTMLEKAGAEKAVPK